MSVSWDSDLELDDSDFSDEEIVQFLAWERRPYIVRPRPDFLNALDDVDFHTRFRLTKQTVLYVLSLIEDEIESPTDRNNSISPITKLLLTLRFYGLGSMLISVGDFCGVSKSSACKIVSQVSRAIAALAPRFIKMPSGDEILEVQREFYSGHSMPRVIGAIDCTHIRILSPGGEHAEHFRNRKGYFSLNVQTISRKNLKIMDIVVRWPGSTHGQTIFNKSRVKQRLRVGEFGNGILVADSGFANTNYMITPLLRISNEVEARYNESLIRTRNAVECQYGVWKRRFPVLSLGMRLKLGTTMTVIIATAVLHNLAIDRDSLPPNDPAVGYLPQEDTGNTDQTNDADDYSTNMRDRLIAEYFAHL